MLHALLMVIVCLRTELLLALGLTLHNKVVLVESLVVFLDDCNTI